MLECAVTALCIKQNAISLQKYNVSTVYNIFCAHVEHTINFCLQLYKPVAKDRPLSTSSASSVPTSSKPTITRGEVPQPAVPVNR